MPSGPDNRKPLTILHVESGRNWGGQEYRNLVEIAWLNRHGHRAWLACDPLGRSLARAQESAVPVLSLTLRPAFNPATTFKLSNFCRRNKVDIIQTHSSKDAWLCLPLFLAGRPVARMRNIMGLTPRASRLFIYRHGCSRIIATAEAIKRELAAAGIPARHISTVGEGVDLEKFHPGVDGSEFRRELGVPPGAPLIGMIGRWTSEKGPLNFVEAALQVLVNSPQARFVLIGEGRMQKKLEENITEGLRALHRESSGPGAPIFLMGYRDDVPQILTALDVVAIPSHSEAQCRVLVEAFAAGRAVVASEGGGIPEVLQNEANGLLVPPGRSELLAAAIERLIDDSALRMRLGAAALLTARARHSLDGTMAETLRIYRELIGGGSGGAA